MRLSLSVAAASAAFLVLTGVAYADRTTGTTTMVQGPTGDALRLSMARPIQTQVAGQPGPIRLDACYSDGRGTDGLSLVHHAVRITNAGDRPITAIRIRFAFYDAFGDVSASRTNIAEATLGPGQTADRINLAELSDSGPPSRITCSIDGVRYADGSIARVGP